MPARRSRLVSCAVGRHNALLGYAAFLSTVIVRGFTVGGWPNALRKKRLADSASRLAESRKSIVWPWLSTARYR
jgi:hypothetical protein